MTYLAELYVALGATLPATRSVDGARSVIYVPEDEICLLVIDAEDEEAAHAALGRAGFRADRLQRAVERD